MKADPKHRREILKEFELDEDSKGISVPVDKEAITEEDVS